MNTIIVALIFVILFSYIGYPLILIIISVFFKNSILKDDGLFPKVSFLIAAYNEEAIIATKIQNSLELDYPKEKIEIIIVSDGSTDKTDEIVKQFESFGVRLFRVEGRVGKTEARNRAVLAMKNEIIIFSDATAIYKKDAVLKLVRNFADKSVGMVSGNLSYFDKDKSSMGIATKIYWSYELAIKKAQSRMFTLTGAVGCINAFRRELYHVLPANIIEDFTEPLMIVAQNYRIVYEEEAFAFERTTQKPLQEFQMRVRVIRGGMKGFLYAFKRLNFKNHFFVILQLIGHKVLRWLMPIFLILLFLISLVDSLINHQPIMLAFFLVQVLCYFIAVYGIILRPVGIVGKIVSIPTYFVVVNGASLTALYLTLTKDLEATWDTNVY
ncbi:MAG: glycosyltransferase family 2 protein [Bacteriovorax sp.]|nr:glycosyltransferase family 2 protein [Bacteriovorax sp.]